MPLRSCCQEKVTLRILITLFVLAAAAFGSPINLVQNGGFETGDLTGWTIDAQTNNPWEVDRDAPHGGTFEATNGCEDDICVIGSPVNQLDFLSQNLSTEVGHTYTLSFFYDPGNPGSEGDVSDLLVNWAGATVMNLFLAGSGGDERTRVSSITPAGGYNQYSIDLLATSTSTELSFIGRQDANFSFLDDIAVTDKAGSAVPEPSSYLLVVSGLLWLGMASLRARRT
jgi:hypothetical protein